MGPDVDNRRPREYPHLKRRLKKWVLLEENNEKIERENTVLLDRMARQWSVAHGISNLNPEGKLIPLPERPHPSLQKRMERARTIAQENEVLFNRVEHSKPIYDKHAWQEDRHQNLTYLANMSRFPEGYTDVFQKSGVPLPAATHGPLPIRNNRSFTLKLDKLERERAKEREKERDRSRSPNRHDATGDFAESGEGQEGQVASDRKLRVYMTRSARLKHDYAQAVIGGTEEMSRFRAAHTEAMIRYGRPLSPDEEMQLKRRAEKMKEHSQDSKSNSDQEARAKQTLPVRLNRAQQLRLEEQERERARLLAAKEEKMRDKRHLSHVEARVDFGQAKDPSAASGVEEAKDEQIDLKEEERQKVLEGEVDEEAYGYENVPIQSNLIDPKRAVLETEYAQSVYNTTTFLHPATPLPPPHRCETRAFWCAAAEEDSRLEREVVVDEVVPNVREYARSLGLEFAVRDMEWGWTRRMEDEHVLWETIQAESSNSASTSVGMDSIVLLTNKRGDPPPLPSCLPANVFDTILETVERRFSESSTPQSNNQSSRSDLLRRIYKLDFNAIPPHFRLRKISDMIPDWYSKDEDLHEHAMEEWKQLSSIALQTFALATQHLMADTDEGPGDDMLDLLDGLFLKSAFEIKIDSILENEELSPYAGTVGENKDGVGGGSGTGVLIKRVITEFKPLHKSAPEGKYLDWVRKEKVTEPAVTEAVADSPEEAFMVNSKAEEDVAKIETRLLASWGDDRFVQTERALPLQNSQIRWQPSGIQPRLYPTHQAYLTQVQDATTSRIMTVLENSAEQARGGSASTLPSWIPCTAEEKMRLEILHHIRLYHNKVVGRKGRQESLGMGNTGYVPFIGYRGTVEQVSGLMSNAWRAEDGTPPLLVCGRPGTGKSTLVCWAVRKIIEAEWEMEGNSIEEARQTMDPSPNNTGAHMHPSTANIKPTVVIRFIGTSPQSSTPAALMTSICQQILLACSQSSDKASHPTPAIFNPFENPTAIPTDHSSLCAFFRSTLESAAAQRPIVIVLLGLDKLDDFDNSRKLGWLPVEDIPTGVCIICTLSQTETGAAAPVDILVNRIKSVYKSLLEAQVPFTIPSSIVSQHGIIRSEEFTLRDASVALRSWLNAVERKVHRSQRRVILESIFTSDERVNPISWKLITSRVARWCSAHGEEEADGGFEAVVKAEALSRVKLEKISIDAEGLLDNLLKSLEERHGYRLLCQTFQYVCCLRDGITEHELFDLLSTDRSVLAEVFSQVSPKPLTKSVGNGPPSVMARLPPVVFADLLKSLIVEWEILIRHSQGAYGGQPIIRFKHRSFEDAAKRRYLSDRETKAIKNSLASYFTSQGGGLCDEGSPPSLGERSEQDTIQLRGGLSMPLSGLHKHLPPQDTDLAGSNLDPPVYNVRKIREAPTLLVATQRWKDLKTLLTEFDFIEGLLVVEVGHKFFRAQ
ncbi:hypothetical protein HDV00_004821 [Rhizophlyctis rosea]|nr:hypothetical protein HDV00_004821 [Rhizophlyctis rosea]